VDGSTKGLHKIKETEMKMGMLSTGTVMRYIDCMVRRI
jgi:hypothetical protein